jgi:hypothetical protein
MSMEFERRENETVKAFTAFTTYLGMGAQRSLEAVRLKLGKSKALIERWSVRHQWVERTAAYERHLSEIERRTEESLTRAKAVTWALRREEHKEIEWQVRCDLVEAGLKQLERFRDGTKGATLGDVARALELASKLGRLASGMATDKTELTGEDGGPIKVEISAALDKIYGAEVIEADVIEEGAR